MFQIERCTAGRYEHIFFSNILFCSRVCSDNTNDDHDIGPPQCLLHLGLLLQKSDSPVICKLEGQEKAILTWKEEDWERKLDSFHLLSDLDYAQLADVFNSYWQFESTRHLLDEKTIQSQSTALRARLGELDGTVKDICDLPIQKFDRSTNIIMLCASVGIFTVGPALDEKEINERLVDIEYHASQLRQSPLYQPEGITTKNAEKELRAILSSMFWSANYIRYVRILENLEKDVASKLASCEAQFL